MNSANIIKFWSDFFASSIPFWRSWDIIAKYQGDIWENYTKIFLHTDTFKSLWLAPQKLMQSILSPSFSLMQFTSEIKGDSEVEYDILTKIAGYGSQLGTIMDFLELLEKKYGLDPKTYDNPEDAYKYYKFKDLLAKIKKTKGMAVNADMP
jgi:hypothetical protein